jgi:hypothetical protein
MATSESINASIFFNSYLFVNELPGKLIRPLRKRISLVLASTSMAADRLRLRLNRCPPSLMRFWRRPENGDKSGTLLLDKKLYLFIINPNHPYTYYSDEP